MGISILKILKGLESCVIKLLIDAEDTNETGRRCRNLTVVATLQRQAESHFLQWGLQGCWGLHNLFVHTQCNTTNGVVYLWH